MDLSCWMEPDARFKTASFPWIDLCGGEIAQTLARETPPAPVLRIERCLGGKDAVRRLECPEVLGVYCLSLAEGQAVHGLEKWKPENGPPGSRDEMLVSVFAAVPELAVVPEREEPSENAPGARGKPSVRGGRAPDLLNPETAAKAVEAIRSARPAFSSKEWESFLALHLARCAPGAERPGDVIWTPDLPRLYRERWNEDATDFLPYLWFQGPGAPRFRRRFRALAADLFEEHFLKPLAAWRQEAGLHLLGRFAPDDSLVGQVLDGWGPVQRFFEWVRVPGVAGACAAAWPVSAFRQATSAAAQSSTPRADPGIRPDFPAGLQCDLCRNTPGPETLAEFALEAARRLAMGAGFLTVPDPSLSLRGDGKRSTGGALFHRAQPWWPAFEALDRSLGRLNHLLSQGRRVANALVLVPADSVQALAASPLPKNLAGLAGKSPELNIEANEIERLFQQTLLGLETFQIAYDLADEDVIARHGEPRANAFRVGAGEYTTVIVPPAFTWRAETLAKLRRFARKGGSLILARPLAEHVDLEPAKALEALAEEYPNVYVVERAGREVSSQVNRVDPACFRIKAKAGQSTEGLLVQHRRTETHDLFFIVNPSPEQDVEARVFFYADGAVRLLDPWTPRIFIREADQEKNALAFDFSFHAASSALFAVGGEADLTEPPYQRLPHPTSSEPLDATWEFERADPNFLPLGNCRWSCGDAELSQEMPVEFARAAMRERSPENGVPIALVFAFESELEERKGVLELVVESNDGMEVLLNGEPLALEAREPLDPEFRRADVAGKVRPGANEIVVRFPYAADAVVEAPILAGDFAVSRGTEGLPLLSREPRVLRNGPLSKQGYPYYAGRMRYRQRVALEIHERNRYFLTLRKPAACVVSVKIGEHRAVPALFPPHRLEITRTARPGENDVEIELVSSLYNLYGPVHLSAKLLEEPGFSASSYDERPYRDRQLWTRRPNLAPFGLLEGAALETFDPAAQPPEPAPPEPTPPEGSEQSAAQPDENERHDTDEKT